jgi:hypothetical protein
MMMLMDRTNKLYVVILEPLININSLKEEIFKKI